MTAPALGTYVRPVGEIRYAYCYRVVKVLHLDGADRQYWECERWGMHDGQPFNDGNRRMSYLRDILEVVPGVWKDEWTGAGERWFGIPLYFKRIDVDLVQKELF